MFPQVPVLVGVARFAESGTQAVAYVIDLTERKRVEVEARDRQRRHRDIQLELEHASRVARRTAAGTASKFGPSFRATCITACLKYGRTLEKRSL